MNKKLTFCILSLLALVLASCSPVPSQNDIAREPFPVDPRGITVDTSNAKKLVISFEPMKGAVDYTVYVKRAGTDDTPVSVHVNTKRNFSDGLLTVSVGGLRPESDYEISIRAIGMNGEEIIFRSPEIWYTSSLRDSSINYSPEAWIDRISYAEDGTGADARIKIRKEEGRDYEAYITSPDGEVTMLTVPAGTGQKSIDTSGNAVVPGARITVRHGIPAENEGEDTLWSSETCTLTFPDNILSRCDAVLKESKGTFSWRNYSGSSELSLIRSRADGSYETLETVPGTAE